MTLPPYMRELIDARAEIDALRHLVNKLQADNEQLRVSERQRFDALTVAGNEIERLHDRETKLSERVIATRDYERLRACLERLLREDDIYAGIGGFFDEIRAALENKP